MVKYMITEGAERCPFCKYETLRMRIENTRTVDAVKCQVFCICGATGPVAATPQKALKKWNVRNKELNQKVVTERIQPAASGGLT